jgi:NADH-quinone oxidoreductase subunit J
MIGTINIWSVAMTIQQILFILVAAATLGSALMVVTVRNLVHAALWLIACLAGVAVLFVFLSAGFLAVAQVVIYIGAISILMIFTIMLTRNVALEPGRQLNSNWIGALILSAAMFVMVILLLSKWTEISMTAPELPANYDALRFLGLALVAPNGYVLPFELASVLLLAALIGAIVVAWGRR